MQTRILLSALFTVCRLCNAAAPADDMTAPADETPAAAAWCVAKPVEDAKDPPRCDPADRTFCVRVRDNKLTLHLGDEEEEDGLSIACEQFNLQFDGENDEQFKVECCGGVRIGWSKAWAGLPACLIQADTLRFNSADATALLTSNGKDPCRLEFILPGTDKPSKLVADEIRVDLRNGRVEAKGEMSVFLPKEDD